MTSRQVAYNAAQYALNQKAENVILIDLKTVTSMTDYFVVCHAQTDIQVKAIADAVMDGLRMEGEKPWHSEGIHSLNWVLLDYVDIVVHIFKKDVREFYGLESLWGDAPQEQIVDELNEN
ncbi:ribosome silencing factor [bacterium]|nr:ribosome silencing factor [bacterium]